MIYKLYKTIESDVVNAAITVDNIPEISFLFNPENTDYQNFKANINDESAQLEDADGVLMSPEEAKEYVATLP